MKSIVTDDNLVAIRQSLNNPTSMDIKLEIKKKFNVDLDESTIRGRYIGLGWPLSCKKPVKVDDGERPAANPPTPKAAMSIRSYAPAAELLHFIPKDDEFKGYVDRDIDNRLATHYETGKNPITQGPQGTGKTFSHQRYAHRARLPFILISCHEDMKLHKLFGDKTIENGSIIFKESAFVKACQSPSVILFDEINVISNKHTYDFHALLQNRELFVKDADNGNGKWYTLHPDCKIGFSMNPKSNKYIGGNVKPSNFLGRCTFLSYPQFSKKEVGQILKNSFQLSTSDQKRFVEYFFAILKTIDKAELPIDISIRQMNHMADLYSNGLGIAESIEDSISGMLYAVSQPKAIDAFNNIAKAVFSELK